MTTIVVAIIDTVVTVLLESERIVMEAVVEATVVEATVVMDAPAVGGVMAEAEPVVEQIVMRPTVVVDFVVMVGCAMVRVVERVRLAEVGRSHVGRVPKVVMGLTGPRTELDIEPVGAGVPELVSSGTVVTQPTCTTGADEFGPRGCLAEVGRRAEVLGHLRGEVERHQVGRGLQQLDNLIGAKIGTDEPRGTGAHKVEEAGSHAGDSTGRVYPHRRDGDRARRGRKTAYDAARVRSLSCRRRR